MAIFSNTPGQAGSVDYSAPINQSTASGYGSVQLQGTFQVVCWDYVTDHDSQEIHYLNVSVDCNN